MEALIVGDSHGNISFMKAILEIAYEHGYPGVFHVGDFGWWPTQKDNAFVNYVDKKSKSLGLFVWALDGNHDFPGANPIDLRGYLPWKIKNTDLTCNKDDEFWYNHTGLKWIPRGSHTIIDNKRVGFIGGAVSIDRNIQNKRGTYFVDEMLTAEDVEYIKQMGEIDILISHDRLGIPPHMAKWSFGEVTDAYLLRQNGRFKEIYNVLNPKIHFHGHYHTQYTSQDEEWPGCFTVGLAYESLDAFIGFNFETLEITKPSYIKEN
jgi:hypothetical protein